MKFLFTFFLFLLFFTTSNKSLLYISYLILAKETILLFVRLIIQKKNFQIIENIIL